MRSVENPRINMVELSTIEMKKRFSHRTIPLSEILAECCEICQQNLERVKTADRSGPLVLCRVLFCHVATQYKIYSLKEIGEAIGGRDHTTVIHSRERAKSWLDINDTKFMIIWEKYKTYSKIYKYYIAA